MDELNKEIATLLGWSVTHQPKSNSYTLIAPDGAERPFFGSEQAAWWNVPQFATDMNAAIALPVDPFYHLELRSGNFWMATIFVEKPKGYPDPNPEIAIATSIDNESPARAVAECWLQWRKSREIAR